MIQALSFELLDQYCPVAWKQRDADGNAAATGYTPPSTLLSPTSAAAMRCGWVRRGSGGFAWADGVDAPLDGPESYAVEISIGGSTLRHATVTSPSWRYVAAERAADGAPGALVTIAVAQLGTLPGPAARATFLLP